MLRRPAALAVLSLALAACDALLGIEPWSSEPEGTGGGAEGGGGATTSSAGGTATSTGEGGASCEAGLERCGAECVALDGDPRHCGSCDRSCFGGSCTDGDCGIAELGSEGFVGGAARITTTDGWIAWTAPSGSVRALRKADAEPALLASGLSPIRALDGAAQSFVFADTADSNGVARVHRAEPEAGLPTIIAQGPDAAAQDLLIDGGTVFAAGGSTTSTQGVYSFPLNGLGASPALVCGNSVSVFSSNLAVGGNFVYSRRSGTNAVYACAKTGSSASQVSENAAGAVAVDDSFVYFSYGASILVRAFPVLGESLFLSAPATISQLEVSTRHIAWRSGASVYLADKVAGASSVLIATEQNAVADLALDDDGVYWITNQGVVRALSLTPPTPSPD